MIKFKMLSKSMPMRPMFIENVKKGQRDVTQSKIKKIMVLPRYWMELEID